MLGDNKDAGISRKSNAALQQFWGGREGFGEFLVRGSNKWQVSALRKTAMRGSAAAAR
jgi:hypothetical protein